MDMMPSSYDDWKLQAPEEPELGPVDCLCSCVHMGACLMQLERFEGNTYEDVYARTKHFARVLGCGTECECFEEVGA